MVSKGFTAKPRLCVSIIMRHNLQPIKWTDSAILKLKCVNTGSDECLWRPFVLDSCSRVFSGKTRAVGRGKIVIAQ